VQAETVQAVVDQLAGRLEAEFFSVDMLAVG
jgi:hypothetical protein